MIVDLLILALAISALVRGREIGFVRQLLSTVGFFGGLFIGALLEPHTITLAHSPNARSLIALTTTVGCALLLLSLGEYVGIKLKHQVLLRRVNALDNWFGAILSSGSLLISVWLGASILSSLPLQTIQTALRSSRIITAMDQHLPPAPNIIADLGTLIDPNGFPKVFIGGEPNPNRNVPLPNLGQLQNAVIADKNSVVKIEGQGCGGIVEGSGFVVGTDLIATNAHVIAGIHQPYVEDANGSHRATAIWFDPNLDFAVLRVSNLAGKPLLVSSGQVGSGTPGAVLGYPGGGSFNAEPAAVLDEFTATGRNIYGRGNTNRNVYELQADVIPGNSGGPLVNEKGSVMGVVFAESTTYNHVGYALTTDQVISEINQAEAQNQPVGTGSCAQ